MTTANVCLKGFAEMIKTMKKTAISFNDLEKATKQLGSLLRSTVFIPEAGRENGTGERPEEPRPEATPPPQRVSAEIAEGLRILESAGYNPEATRIAEEAMATETAAVTEMEVGSPEALEAMEERTQKTQFEEGSNFCACPTCSARRKGDAKQRSEQTEDKKPQVRIIRTKSKKGGSEQCQ